MIVKYTFNRFPTFLLLLCHSKERVDKLQSKLSELTKNNEEVVATDAQIEMYEKSIKEHADAIEKLQAAVNERDEAISTSENEYEDALKQWQGKYSFHFVLCEND